MTFPESFHFLRPLWLLGLAALPLIALLVRSRSRSAGAWQRVCDPRLLPHLLAHSPDRGARLGPGLLGIGWLAACLALAGPTWERLPQTAYDEPTSTVVVLSLAPSLLAKDVAPSRLARARFELQDLLAEVEGSVGLVIFAEEAYPVTPLTDDPRVVAQLVPVLAPDLMPGRGARLDRGIDEARGLLANATARGGRIVLIVDGAGDAPVEAVEAAGRARADGHVVSVLALAGADAALDAVAEAGGGALAVLRADDADVARVLASSGALPSALGALQRSEVQADVWRDMGPWLVLVPLLLAPFAFRRGWAGALAVLIVLGAGAEDARADVADWFRTPDQRGAGAFAAGRHEDAAAEFEDPEWRAAAHYRGGDFEAAAADLGQLDSSRARYNLGNALAKAGALEEAIAAYDEVLEAEPGHEDARFNRDLVQQLLDPQQEPESGSDAGETGGAAAAEPTGADAQPQADEGSDPAGGAGEEQQAGAAAGAEDPEAPADPDPEAGDGSAGAAADAQAGAESGADGDTGAADAPDPAEVAGTAPAEAAGAEPPADAAPAQGAGSGSAPGPAPPGDRVATAGADAPLSEGEQAMEQRLSRVPDDPGALLREKLRRRYAEKQGLPWRGPGVKRW